MNQTLESNKFPSTSSLFLPNPFYQTSCKKKKIEQVKLNMINLNKTRRFCRYKLAKTTRQSYALIAIDKRVWWGIEVQTYPSRIGDIKIVVSHMVLKKTIKIIAKCYKLLGNICESPIEKETKSNQNQIETIRMSIW